MKASDIQLLMVVRGLYREGYKTITIKELQRRCDLEESRGARPAKWYKDAKEVRKFLNTAPGWDVWYWGDRLCKAVKRVEKTGRIKVDGKLFKNGYSIHSTIHLWDYTIKQMFGDQAFQFVVMNKV